MEKIKGSGIIRETLEWVLCLPVTSVIVLFLDSEV